MYQVTARDALGNIAKIRVPSMEEACKHVDQMRMEGFIAFHIEPVQEECV